MSGEDFARFESGEFPWDRSGWSGDLVSLDGAEPSDVTFEDVAEVVWLRPLGVCWSGTSAGVARLRDGRFVAWESDVDATGSGFHGDAVGGFADVMFASTEEEALLGISEAGREGMTRVAALRPLGGRRRGLEPEDALPKCPRCSQHFSGPHLCAADHEAHCDILTTRDGWDAACSCKRGLATLRKNP